jgi:lactoylglutathione lyase
LLGITYTAVNRRITEGRRRLRELPLPASVLLPRLLDPRLTDPVLAVLGDRGTVFDPLLHNTVNATIVGGGDKVNVIPSVATVELDGRLLPGFTGDDMLRELRALLGPDVDVEVVRYDPGPPEPDVALFDLLAGVLRHADPKGTPIPLLLAAFTDARHVARLGIQHYGFTPMQLPKEMRFTERIHAADERVPVEALEFGASDGSSAGQTNDSCLLPLYETLTVRDIDATVRSAGNRPANSAPRTTRRSFRGDGKGWSFVSEAAHVRELRVAITAPDYDEALVFYRDVLGLREREAFASEDGRVTILEAGRATLELLDLTHAAFVDDVEVGRRVAGHVRIAFEVEDSATTTRALAAAGATVLAEPTRTPWNSLNARLEGPAGLQLTLFTELGP